MSINPDGTPGPVAPGEIIDSEWGNAVAESIQDLQTVAPVGSIWMWMAGAIPTKCLPLQGGNADRTVYSDLFALWGTQFGAGDGTTTFGLPDMRARFPVGISPGDALFATANNKGGGRDAVLPVHGHTINNHTHADDIVPSALPHYVPKWNQGPGYPGTPGNYIAIPDNNVPGNGDYDGSTFGASAGTAHTHLFSIQAGMSLTGGSDGFHDHGLSLAGPNDRGTDAPGVDPTNGRIPPFIVINFIVKAQRG